MFRFTVVLTLLFAIACSKELPLSGGHSVAPMPHQTTSGVSCPGTFDIELVYLEGERPLRDIDVFMIELAKDRWESIITGDLYDVNFRSNPYNEFSSLLQSRVRVNDRVDDIRIFLRVRRLEDAAGSAWVTWIRTDTKLPILAEMVIDPYYLNDDNITRKTFYKVILHEMGHCLGFGTLWNDMGLLKNPSRKGYADPYFDGLVAQLTFLAMLGDRTYRGKDVPVENGDDVHWRSSVFGDELMARDWVAPYDRPISGITTGAMADMGYEVNSYAADERYVLALGAAKPSPKAPEAPPPMKGHITGRPIRVADENGRLVETIHP